jgi:hypothetical protein
MDEQDEYFETLLPHIEEHRVIPVVGPGLLTISREGGEIPLYRAVAEKVLELYATAKPARGEPAFDPAIVALRPHHELNDAVSAVLHLRRRDPYSTVARALSEVLEADGKSALSPLRLLGEIDAFDLFVTTTIDDLLVRAINQVRHDGLAKTRQILHVPNLPTEEFRDISEADFSESQFTAVLHLFGRARNAQLYAIHDEDTLEYIHNLQTRGSNVPERFISRLRTRDLLMIGCRFPDWLTRFFLRLSSQNRLGDDQRPKREFLVDEANDPADGLIVFLERFSRQTCVYHGSPQEFVAELSRRWTKAHLPTGSGAVSATSKALPSAAQDTVFISYTRADVAAATALRGELKEIGVDAVWFDHTALRPGDDWSKEIAAGIRRCYLFLPVISAHTEARDEGYFREEWRQAAERARQIEGRTFIVPVVIDANYAGNAGAYTLVPDAFPRQHFGHAPAGRLTQPLRDQLIALIRQYRLQKAA